MTIFRGGFGVVLSGCCCPSAPALAPPAPPVDSSQPVDSSEPDTDISAMFACRTEPAMVVVTPSPPTPDLDGLCAAFRSQPAVGEHGCGMFSFESEQLWEVHVATESIVGVTIAGFGVPVANSNGVVSASEPALRALGVDPESFRSWLVTATRNGVRRIVRRPAVISDPYHGQPGLVVRTDIGFELKDRWLICMDKDSRLLDDNDPNPPEGTTCKRLRPGWWTCAAR